ncbi:hypothetical protein GHT06_017849 [Daphnia sinensis]|uniref:Uncharacterized protein n=1 Tax=Daphnia sinensis TaxID=1820382 RepID=A0AAD5KLQ7_9CRUS|nr:hypothetical protein GHT06_017849 [Daphnia sinensis]
MQPHYTLLLLLSGSAFFFFFLFPPPLLEKTAWPLVSRHRRGLFRWPPVAYISSFARPGERSRLEILREGGEER